MVNFCAVVGCGNRSDRDKGVSFYRLPAETTHQGERTQELSKKRRDLFLESTGITSSQVITLDFALNTLWEVSSSISSWHK